MSSMPTHNSCFQRYDTGIRSTCTRFTVDGSSPVCTQTRKGSQGTCSAGCHGNRTKQLYALLILQPPESQAWLRVEGHTPGSGAHGHAPWGLDLENL